MSSPKLKKILLWVAAVVFAYLIFTSPEQAADLVKSAWHLVEHSVLQGKHFLDDVFSS